MVLLLADKQDPQGSLVKQMEQFVASQHWYDAFQEHFVQDKDRYDAMQAIMDDAGWDNFSPQLNSLFMSLIDGRYFGNEAFFLCDEDVKNLWDSKKDEGGGRSFDLGKAELYFPNYEYTLKSLPEVPTFAFLGMPVSTSDKHLLFDVLKKVKKFLVPAVVLKSHLIEALEHKNLLSHFDENMQTVIATTNHDYIHGLTNLNRHARDRIAEHLNFRSKFYMRFFVNPAVADNGLTVEECAVIEMNRLIFERLRAAPNNERVNRFFGAVDFLIEIIGQLQADDKKASAKAAASVLKGSLSFIFDANLLQGIPVEDWGAIIRNAPTRRDIRIGQFTSSKARQTYHRQLFEMREQNPPLPPREMAMRVKSQLNELLSNGDVSITDPRNFFASLHAAVHFDLGPNGSFLMWEGHRKQVIEATMPQPNAPTRTNPQGPSSSSQPS